MSWRVSSSGGRGRTDGNPDGTDHHADQAVLGLGLAALGGSPLHVVALQEGHDGEGEAKPYPDGDKRKADEAVVPMVVVAEDNGVAEEECVLHTCEQMEMDTVVRRRTRRP